MHFNNFSKCLESTLSRKWPAINQATKAEKNIGMKYDKSINPYWKYVIVAESLTSTQAAHNKNIALWYWKWNTEVKTSNPIMKSHNDMNAL